MEFITSLSLTVGAYCSIPLLMASIGKTPLTRKRFCLFCFLLNAVINLVFSVLSRSFSYSPYFIWTTVFYFVGREILKERGLLLDAKSAERKDEHNA